MINRFHITTGDTDGVGLEVTLKSLIPVLRKSKNCAFFIWIHTEQKKVVLKFISKNPKLKNHISFTKSTNEFDSKTKFNFILNESNSPAKWFVKATEQCLKNKDAVITAPLSKTQIRDEGFSEIGHTEILKKLTQTNNLNMAFVGKYFSMILFTDHIPISKLKLDIHQFDLFLSASVRFHQKLNPKKSELRILGFNPHAGDQGLIGSEDLEILKLVNKKYNINKLWPADSAFVNYKSFKNKPTFLSSYHDQGLIPFKMAHGFTGYHHTLGLPFIRTSVDHGTAKEIFNKNLANPKSMIDAILGAIHLKKGVL